MPDKLKRVVIEDLVQGEDTIKMAHCEYSIELPDGSQSDFVVTARQGADVDDVTNNDLLLTFANAKASAIKEKEITAYNDRQASSQTIVSSLNGLTVTL